MIWVLALVGCAWITGAERAQRIDHDGDGASDPRWLEAGDPAADCDDDNDKMAPTKAEVCDELDNDCDGKFDEDDDSVTDATIYHPDEDNDGFGDPLVSIPDCGEPFGLILDDKDCADEERQDQTHHLAPLAVSRGTRSGWN